MKGWLGFAAAFMAHAALALPVMSASVSTANKTIPLTLEVASTPETRATGLMKRTTLAPFDGMLFAFPSTQRVSFWMKDTIVPLDILFLDADGVVRHIAANTTPFSLEPISSGGAFLTAIELAAGRAEREGIMVGSRIQFSLPKELYVQ